MLGYVILSAPLNPCRFELMYCAIVMYVLLLFLLNVVLMVPLRIQTSLTICSVILCVWLIEQKRIK